ncbi:phosphohydrolase [Maribellus luteus]|uniref:Phosphohydrolase n=1 Tax=Maribellus luteus TaxID=2305463 RepID=A0A399T5P3_9BACT|nr:metallophosphoesterase family protein [Maribellus luteus]RIJ50459.1 phosphohydrolase [Maribellus luteus]
MRKMTLKILVVLVVVLGLNGTAIGQQTLHFNEDKTFKIVQFTDLHFMFDSPKSEVVLPMINEVLDIERPDLVVFTGDAVTKAPVFKGWELLTAPMIDRGIPWVAVLGNHDDESDKTRSEIMEELVQLEKNCIAYKTEEAYGTGNYVLEIKGGDKTTKALLYCMDSNAYSTVEGTGTYGWFTREQINWYTQKSNNFTEKNNGEAIPALAFFHIPLPEYTQAWSNGGMQPVGVKNEDVCSPSLNSGMFLAMLEQGDVMGTFVGHDHVNDYISSLYGIALAYGRFSGSGDTYGDLKNGARVIVLKEDKWEFDTWLRIRGGEKINETVFTRSNPE